MLAGIDLGGTQVRVALARSDGRLVASVKTRTHLLATPQDMVDWAAAEIDRHRGREKVRSITIAAPGPIDVKRGVLVNPPNLPWQNVPLAAMMSRATGARVQLANDADMAGLGEFHHGAGRGTRNMVYITWSTGVGGGLIIDGKLHRGGHGTAGEIGHMIIDPNGPLDNCGQRGCLEAFVSGTALAGLPVSRARAVPLTNASRQPRWPQLSSGPLGSMIMCPISPAVPCAPRWSRPSMIRPPPTPVDQVM